MKGKKAGKKTFGGVIGGGAYNKYPIDLDLYRVRYFKRVPKQSKYTSRLIKTPSPLPYPSNWRRLPAYRRSLSSSLSLRPSHPHSIKSSQINHLRKQNVETRNMTAFKGAYKCKLSDSKGLSSGLDAYQQTVEFVCGFHGYG